MQNICRVMSVLMREKRKSVSNMWSEKKKRKMRHIFFLSSWQFMGDFNFKREIFYYLVFFFLWIWPIFLYCFFPSKKLRAYNGDRIHVIQLKHTIVIFDLISSAEAKSRKKRSIRKRMEEWMNERKEEKMNVRANDVTIYI